jgi:predicted transcriptional regulator
VRRILFKCCGISINSRQRTHRQSVVDEVECEWSRWSRLQVSAHDSDFTLHGNDSVDANHSVDGDD